MIKILRAYVSTASHALFSLDFLLHLRITGSGSIRNHPFQRRQSRRIWGAPAAAQGQRGYLLHARSFTAWRPFRMTSPG